jgi:S1-C subfamily serine protease
MAITTTLAALIFATLVSGTAPPAEPAWLGVFVGDAIDGGVQLIEVVPGGPAQQAGLLAGDVLIRLAGNPVPDREAVDVIVRAARPGDRLAAEILRRGRIETRWVVAGGRGGPAWTRVAPGIVLSEALAPVADVLGATLAEIPDTLRLHLGAPADRGALVTRVPPRGPAAAAGLRVGDVVLAVDGNPVRDPGAGAVSADGRFRFVEIVRSGEKRTLTAPERAGLEPPGAEVDVRRLQAEVERLREEVRRLERELERERGRRVE